MRNAEAQGKHACFTFSGVRVRLGGATTPSWMLSMRTPSCGFVSKSWRGEGNLNDHVSVSDLFPGRDTVNRTLKGMHT